MANAGGVASKAKLGQIARFVEHVATVGIKVAGASGGFDGDRARPSVGAGSTVGVGVCV